MLCDIGGGADGCASGDEALLGMGDVQCLGNSACRIERSGAGCPVHVTFVRLLLYFRFLVATLKWLKVLGKTFVMVE